MAAEDAIAFRVDHQLHEGALVAADTVFLSGRKLAL
jgi:hypothetical protein